MMSLSCLVPAFGVSGGNVVDGFREVSWFNGTSEVSGECHNGGVVTAALLHLQESHCECIWEYKFLLSQHCFHNTSQMCGI